MSVLIVRDNENARIVRAHAGSHIQFVEFKSRGTQSEVRLKVADGGSYPTLIYEGDPAECERLTTSIIDLMRGSTEVVDLASDVPVEESVERLETEPEGQPTDVETEVTV